MLTTNTISTPSTRGRARALLLAGFAALPLLGAASIAAHAQSAPAGQMHQRGHEHAGDIEKRVDQMLKRVNATADQQTEVHAIMQAAKTDLAPMRASMRDSRKQTRALLGAPQIDAAAIEALRAQDSATRDQMSRRATAAIVEAANVLTPDQRANLATMAPGREPNRPQ
jgi:protein CpxP